MNTVTPEQISKAFLQVRTAMEVRRLQKGYEPYPSFHAILGSVTEETHELLHAVHQNDEIEIFHELIDVAVAALYGLASMYCQEEKQ